MSAKMRIKSADEPLPEIRKWKQIINLVLNVTTRLLSLFTGK